MATKLNKKDLVEIVSERARVSKRDAEAVIDETFDAIVESVQRDQEVNITNFGVFVPKTRKTRDGTHPSSHEIIKIPAKKTVFFRLSKYFKAKIN